MIIVDFQDYDDDDPDIEFRRERHKYWSALKELNAEYKQCNSVMSFIQWVEEKYGFIITLENGTGISDVYTVVNEAKFIFFKLKYL